MIRLVVDSSADLSLEEIKEKEITLISLAIHLNDKNYLDGIDITKDSLYEWLMAGKENFPKTSQPAPAEFVSVFEDAKDCGDEVICILLSSALSGTYQSACIAKDMVGYDNVHIIDSLTVSHAIRILVLQADKMRRTGFSAQEIVMELEELKTKIKIFAAVDTLEYLYRGGRLNRTTAAIGTLANLKPVVTVSEAGTVDVAAKCLGKAKMLLFLNNLAKEANIDTSYPVYTLYTYGDENVSSFEEKLTANGIRFTERAQVGASIGSHVGPGACGLIYVQK